MVHAGAMRHVIRIEKRSRNQGSTGEQILQWNLVMTRRAAIESTPGAEVFASAEREGRVPTVFRLRFPRTIEVLPEMRVVWGQQVFEILSAVDPDGLKVDMVITAFRRVEQTP